MARGAGPMVRDAKKAQTRQALIRHAVELFERHGFDRTTVDDIAAAAGVSQRTFFRHFAAKEDVVFDDIPLRLAAFAEALAGAPAELSAWAALRDTFREMTRRYTAYDPELSPVRIRLWMTEPLLYARWTEISLDWEREVAGFLVRRSGSQERPVSDIDAEVVAAAVVSVLRAAWRAEVLHGGQFDELVGQALQRLERGLAGL